MNLTALAAPATLTTARLTLVPQGPQYLDQVMESLQHEEFMRLTGTTEGFSRDAVARFLEGVTVADDRADWAILRTSDQAYLGEVVLNDLDPLNRSMNFRIALSSPEVVGQGYGTEAVEAAVQYGFEVVGLHRISLGVYTFNPRARRVYEKCGFVPEGLERDVLYWQGEWVGQHRMALLRTDPRPQKGKAQKGDERG